MQRGKKSGGTAKRSLTSRGGTSGWGRGRGKKRSFSTAQNTDTVTGTLSETTSESVGYPAVSSSASTSQKKGPGRPRKTAKTTNTTTVTTTNIGIGNTNAASSEVSHERHQQHPHQLGPIKHLSPPPPPPSSAGNKHNREPPYHDKSRFRNHDDIPVSYPTDTDADTDTDTDAILFSSSYSDDLPTISATTSLSSNANNRKEKDNKLVSSVVPPRIGSMTHPSTSVSTASSSPYPLVTHSRDHEIVESNEENRGKQTNTSKRIERRRSIGRSRHLNNSEHYETYTKDIPIAKDSSSMEIPSAREKEEEEKEEEEKIHPNSSYRFSEDDEDVTEYMDRNSLEPLSSSVSSETDSDTDEFEDEEDEERRSITRSDESGSTKYKNSSSIPKRCMAIILPMFVLTTFLSMRKISPYVPDDIQNRKNDATGISSWTLNFFSSYDLFGKNDEEKASKTAYQALWSDDVIQRMLPYVQTIHRDILQSLYNDTAEAFPEEYDDDPSSVYSKHQKEKRLKYHITRRQFECWLWSSTGHHDLKKTYAAVERFCQLYPSYDKGLCQVENALL